MSETLFGESSGIFRLDGERIFHDEARVWEVTLRETAVPIVSENLERSEWYDFWTAYIDIEVDPKSFEVKDTFTLRDATLKPRFTKMTKAQLKSWLESNGFSVPELKTVTKNQLLSRAEYLWFGKSK